MQRNPRTVGDFLLFILFLLWIFCIYFRPYSTTFLSVICALIYHRKESPRYISFRFAEHHRRRRLIIYLSFICITIGITSVLFSGPKEQKINGKPGNPPYITFFLIDGVEYSTFAKNLEQGALPNIKQMIKKGVFVKKGVTSFPSMTGYAFYPVITGRDAADSGILGLRWFSRQSSGEKVGFRNYVGKTNTYMNKDIIDRPSTIYEIYSDQHSSTWQNYMNRGVQNEYKIGWSLTTAKYSKHWLIKLIGAIPFIGSWYTDDWFSYEEKVMDHVIADLRYDPKIQWITFTSPDGLHHIDGSGDEVSRQNYEKVLRHVDAMIGRYVLASVDLNQEKDRIYCILADHGMTTVSKNVDIGEELEIVHGLTYTMGEGTNVIKSKLDNSHVYYQDYDLIFAINGNTAAYIYVKHPIHHWEKDLTYSEIMQYPFKNKFINLVSAVLNCEGVQLVMVRNYKLRSVEVHSTEGVSSVTKLDNGQYEYKVLIGVDPLGYNRTYNGAIFSPDDWLLVTHETSYPYAPVRIWKLLYTKFASVGDLVVTAKPGYDLAKEYEIMVGNYKGGHGGLTRDQMTVPFILKGPGIAKSKTIETARIEDIGATILSVLGNTLSKERDGKIIQEAKQEKNHVLSVM